MERAISLSYSKVSNGLRGLFVSRLTFKMLLTIIIIKLIVFIQLYWPVFFEYFFEYFLSIR